jgi:hypothetical protein
LVYIPPKFRISGEPLIEDETTKKDHLSFHYDTEASEVPKQLALIGVKEMTVGAFFAEFKSLVKRRGIPFLKSQSTQWHAAIATILRRSASTKQLTDIPLIPLRDGTWVTPSEEHLFLNTDINTLTIPYGINLNIVDAAACKSKARREFFAWLGIKICDQADVCRLIMERHKKLASGPLEDIPDLIEDTFYLFNTPRHIYNKSITKLFLVNDQSKLVNGKNLYIDHPDKAFNISTYAKTEGNGVRLLYPDYLTNARKDGREVEFVEWLIQRLHVSTLPCLVRDNQITDEFRYFTTKATAALLLLLRDNWGHYSSQLSTQVSKGLSRKTGMEELSEIKVKCTDGKFHTLNQTVLPLQILKRVGSDLPFLDIPDPGDKRWLQFAELDVITQLNVKLYLRHLRAISSARFSYSRSQVTKSSMQELYRLIQSVALGDESFVR